MVRVSLQGRLGNWLFQYATGRALALRLGTELELVTRRRRLFDSRIRRVRRLLRHFPLHARSVIQPLFSRANPTYVEPPGGFDPRVLTLGDGAWLEGFFQSPLYFEDQAATLRLELMPQLEAIHRRDPSVEAAIAANNSVAVHVRRGDYVQNPLRHLCTPAYYERSMAHCRRALQAPHFFVFSDDVDWCQANMRAADVTVVDTRAEPREIYDLALMGRCQHHIIANSSFSWWSAWLASWEGQLVVTPDRWLGNAEESALAMREMIPPNWLRVATQ